jgi:SAM-dependent methyltransferase
MSTAKIQGELWGAAPREWAEMQEPLHTPLYAAMLNATAVRQGTRLLDVGCGGGVASRLAAERGAEVSGLDAAAGLLAFARQRVPTGDFRVGDMESLPFADNAFDVVFAANSLQFAGNAPAALGEFGRVCVAGGRVVAGLFGPPQKVASATIMKAVGDLMPTPPPGAGPFALSAPGKLEGLLAEAGFTVLESSEVDCPFSYADFATCWRALSSAGPFQGILKTLGESRTKSAMRSAVEPFQRADGSILIQPNVLKYVVAAR